MKKLLLSIMIFIPILVVGQIELKPFGHVEWNNGSYLIGNINHEVNFKIPNYSLKFGLKAKYNNLFADCSSNVFMEKNKTIKFDPHFIDFKISAGIKLSKTIKIKVSHNCIHTLLTRYKHHMPIYGGATKIGMYLN